MKLVNAKTLDGKRARFFIQDCGIVDDLIDANGVRYAGYKNVFIYGDRYIVSTVDRELCDIVLHRDGPDAARQFRQSEDCAALEALGLDPSAINYDSFVEI